MAISHVFTGSGHEYIRYLSRCRRKSWTLVVSVRGEIEIGGGERGLKHRFERMDGGGTGGSLSTARKDDFSRFLV